MPIAWCRSRRQPPVCCPTDPAAPEHYRARHLADVIGHDSSNLQPPEGLPWQPREPQLLIRWVFRRSV